MKALYAMAALALAGLCGSACTPQRQFSGVALVSYPGGQACFTIQPTRADAAGPYWLRQIQVGDEQGKTVWQTTMSPPLARAHEPCIAYGQTLPSATVDVHPMPLAAGKTYEVVLIAAESGQGGDIKGYVAMFKPASAP